MDRWQKVKLGFVWEINETEIQLSKLNKFRQSRISRVSWVAPTRKTKLGLWEPLIERELSDSESEDIEMEELKNEHNPFENMEEK